MSPLREGENMSEQINPPPHYVTCRCQHCDKGIEFDASDFDKGETRALECPHCHLETTLFVPQSPPIPKPPKLEPERSQQRRKWLLPVIVIAIVCVVLAWIAVAHFRIGYNGDYVQTFAGSGLSGDVDGVGQRSMFYDPNQIFADSHGDLFVWDSHYARIRKIAPDGSDTTLSNNNGLLPVTYGVFVDNNDTVWRIGSDCLFNLTSNSTVTKIPLLISTGPLASTIYPSGICEDSRGNFYLSDRNGNVIYRYAKGGLSVFAGSGNQGYTDGNGIFTAFNQPTALACDQADNIYVWDSGNHLIRRIDQNQSVTTFAGIYWTNGFPIADADGIGTNAAFNSVGQMCFDSSGNLYLACGGCIRKIDAQRNVVTLAGSLTQTGYADGRGDHALFNGAAGVCVSRGTIYVADSGNQRIRSIAKHATP